MFKNIFEPNVFKCAKRKIHYFKYFFPFNINVKILSNFQKEWCTFGIKNDI